MLVVQVIAENIFQLFPELGQLAKFREELKYIAMIKRTATKRYLELEYGITTICLKLKRALSEDKFKNGYKWNNAEMCKKEKIIGKDFISKTLFEPEQQ